MKKERFFSGSVLGLLGLTVLTVFAVSILTVLLSAANVCSRLTADTAGHHTRRTAQQYLATRLHQSSGVCREDFGGCDALVIPQQTPDGVYLTRIYCHDGWLRELFSEKGRDFSPEEGEKLLEMEALSVIIEGDLVILTLQLPDGQTQQVLGYTREVDYGQ